MFPFPHFPTVECATDAEEVAPDVVMRDTLVSNMAPIFVYIWAFVNDISAHNPIAGVLVAASSVSVTGTDERPSVATNVADNEMVSRGTQGRPTPESLTTSSESKSVPADLTFASVGV